MTTTITLNKIEKEIPGNYESNPRYLEYVKLLGEYYEIKNDEEKRQSKFNEIITQHKKLVQAGIIVIEGKE